MTVIAIENVGRIRKLSIPVPAGGVVVLRGRNGSGKSTALKAVGSLLSGDKPPQVTDGQTRGSIEGLGVTLRVGRSTRRSGELTVQGFGGGLDISRLVDPGYKDPVAADRARIKSLLQLTGVAADLDAMKQAAGGEEELRQAITAEEMLLEDPVELAAACKRGLERLARSAEQMAEHWQGRAAVLPAVDPDHNGLPDTVRLHADVEEIVEQRAAVDGELKSIETATQNQQRWNEAIERLETRLSSQDVPGLRTLVDTLSGDFNCLQQELAEIEAKRTAISERIRSVRSELQEWRAALERATADEAELATLKSQAQATPIAVRDQVLAKAEQLDRKLKEARQRVELGVRRDADTAARNAAREAMKVADQHKGRASLLRARAADCEAVLSDCVEAAGVPLRAQIKEGTVRLVTDTERGETYFSDLSSGELWTMALDVAVRKAGRGSLLEIDQEAWEGLDPINRAQIDQLAKENGVVILTAECSADEEVTAEAGA